MIEKLPSEIVVGDVIVGKEPPYRHFKVIKIMPGLYGRSSQYFTLIDPDGREVEHDTSFDPNNTKYMVVTV